MRIKLPNFKQLFIWIVAIFHKPHGGTWYKYCRVGVEDCHEPQQCYLCTKRKKHYRYMLGLQGENAGKIFCIPHYFKEVPLEINKIILKINRPLIIITLISILIALTSTIFAFSSHKILFATKITGKQSENLVNWAYSESRNVSRDTIEQIVDTVVRESPNLPFIVLVLAIMHTESNFDPGAIPKIVKVREDGSKEMIDGSARGTMQVLSSHIKELVREGVLPRGSDPKCLHNPIDGTKAGIYYVNKYLEHAKGNTMLGMKYYLQGEGNKYNDPKALRIYFDKTVNIMGKIMLVLDSKG